MDCTVLLFLMHENQTKEMITSLAEMSDKDFVETVYKAIEKRAFTSDTKEGCGHFILANATLDLDDNRWELDSVGLDDATHYPKGFVSDAPLCQFGVCSTCHSKTISWAKNALCALCQTPVYCT